MQFQKGQANPDLEQQLLLPRGSYISDHARQEDETNILGHLPCNAEDMGHFGTVRQQGPQKTRHAAHKGKRNL